MSEIWFDLTIEGDRVVQRQHGGFIPCVGESQCGYIVVATPYFKICRRSLQMLQVEWREILTRIWFLIELLMQFIVLDLHTCSFEHSLMSVLTVVGDFGA